jgi:hypothetical protein
VNQLGMLGVSGGMVEGGVKGIDVVVRFLASSVLGLLHNERGLGNETRWHLHTDWD